jgi:hypothetical protein
VVCGTQRIQHDALWVVTAFPIPIPPLTIFLDIFFYCAPGNVIPTSGSLLTILTDDVAAGAILSLLNYPLLGFAVDVIGQYFHSFGTWLTRMVVSPASGSVALSCFEPRGLSAFFIWIPFLCVPT